MKFGAVPLGEAEGAVLAHSVRLTDGTLRKGAVLGPADLARLAAAGISRVTVARLDASDVAEDVAAGRLAQGVTGPLVRAEPAFTGRANLHAERAGLLVVSRDGVDRLNRVDESITLATLPEFASVEAGRMVGTVKIIPYAVPGPALDVALALVAQAGPLVRVAPFRPLKVGIVSTVLPGLADKVMDKTARVMAERLRPAGASILSERRVPHEAEALAQALREALGEGAELLIAFGASAIADRRDVIPAAIEAAGGRIEHFGMPVDPGNLLLIGAIGDVLVLGAPGCARSPKENGFDWVLQRLLAGIPVMREDVTGMGVGGLLMEIVTRPQPREAPAPDARGPVAGILLAGGQGRRMGGPNKLLATLGEKPLVRIAAEALLASRARPVIVVTGHRAEAVRAALARLEVRFVHNPDYEAGLSTSLSAGIGAAPEDAGGALVCLADMPHVTATTLDRLIAEHEAGGLIVVPTHDGKRGNPVLWSRRFFAALSAIRGDVGARHLIGENEDAVVEVEIGPEVALDLDTRDALAAAGGKLPRGEAG